MTYIWCKAIFYALRRYINISSWERDIRYCFRPVASYHILVLEGNETALNSTFYASWHFLRLLLRYWTEYGWACGIHMEWTSMDVRNMWSTRAFIHSFTHRVRCVMERNEMSVIFPILILMHLMRIYTVTAFLASESVSDKEATWQCKNR